MYLELLSNDTAEDDERSTYNDNANAIISCKTGN